MQWYLRCLTVLFLIETLSSSTGNDDNVHRSKTKRAIGSNFDVLLNIYKLNPLKESNVFKTFSNAILLPRPDERTPDLNFDSNESTKEKRIRMRAKFKQIEDAIHVTRFDKTIGTRPSLNIQNTVEEDVEKQYGINDFTFTKQEPYFKKENENVLLNIQHKDDERKGIENIKNVQKVGHSNSDRDDDILVLNREKYTIVKDLNKYNEGVEVVILK